jgi:deazaflavin-dependent oxidoreductase (nitroreductase family)
MGQTVSIEKKPSDVPAFVDRVVRPLTRAFNPLVLRVAGSRLFPMWALLYHRGRKSGRVYTSPITAIPRGEWFWLGLAFGEESGWARNVLAAGQGRVRYRGVEYNLTEPTVVDGDAVGSELPPITRFFMRLAGVQKVLRMRGRRA